MSSSLERERFPVFTVEECSHCGTKMKRAFREGDYVYNEGSTCSSCGQKTLIIMIYTEGRGS